MTRSHKWTSMGPSRNCWNGLTRSLQPAEITSKGTIIVKESRQEGSLFNSYYTEVYGKGATPFPGLLHYTLDTYPILLCVKQGGIKYHLKNFWYDATWDWTLVARIRLNQRKFWERIFERDKTVNKVSTVFLIFQFLFYSVL